MVRLTSFEQEESMIAQAVRFDKNEGWDLSKAKGWAKEHPMESFDENVKFILNRH